MEPVNKSGKRRRGRCNNWTLTHGSPPDGRMFPAVAVERPEKLDDSVSRQGLPELHEACLYGQLATVQLLVESRQEWVNSSDLQGRRPVHMVLSSRSSADPSSCLTYLLEHGADVNVTTDSGRTPLHLAASEGLLDCTETLMRAGADVLAQDNMGHTPLDVARIWCRRKVARYLKSCMWQEEKKKEMQERKLVQTLYSDLVDVVKLNDLNKKTLVDEKTAEWANKKGFPLLKDLSPRVLASQYHTQCLASDQNTSHPERAKQQREGPPEDQSISTKQPPASSSRPWTVFMGLQPEKPLREPDLRDQVTVWRDGGGGRRPHYTTKWDGTRRPTPDVPLDVLERVLFPRAFPSRIASPRCFEPQDIVEVQHRRYPQGQSTSPWTEVAMHLPEVLEPGHY
ncbi:ankyrin repeat domain-containing protein 53 [Anarrhichthys ocellatus]|uniref:ankyrin repeat domain-containing protein 53 n=1 Tax=Anarrhichthys ocellatus TaxID=433405 RepID=UPI0012ED6A4F|nr:ankyrin repeat domain-containing protein 53 [Anarrhichthys ocellatus]